METRYFIKKQKNSKEGIVHFLFSIEYKKIKISTNKKVKVTNWGKGFPKKTNATKELRTTLNKWKNEINQFIEKKIEIENRIPTRNELQIKCKNLIRGVDETFLEKSIYGLIEKMIEEQELELSTGTIRYKKIHLNHFINIVGKQKKIYDLNEDLLLKYRRVLISENKENTTSNCYMKTIKSFLKWLYDNKLIKNNLSYCLKKQKEIKKDIVTLLEDELIILENSDLETHLQNQIDIFLFGCYTALSISDIKRVNKEMIVDGYIKIRREKTEMILNIPLIPQALEILKKHNYKLPCISDNKGNENLKKAFKILGLNRTIRKTKKINSNKPVDRFIPLYEEISWHKSRKTAITTAIKKGIPHEIVMELSGHTKYETFKMYVKISKEDLKREMKKLSVRKIKKESTIDLSTLLMN